MNVRKELFRTKILTTVKVKIHKKNLNDRKMKLKKSAVSLRISKKRVGQVVHENLGLWKLCVKRLLHELIKAWFIGSQINESDDEIAWIRLRLSFVLTGSGYQWLVANLKPQVKAPCEEITENEANLEQKANHPAKLV